MMDERVRPLPPSEETRQGPRRSSSPVAGAQLEPLLTLRETAAILRVSEKSVRRLVAYQRIPCLRIGRQLRFIPSDVLRWVSARREGG
jgi:excisionase family DNA binding protein